MVEPNGTVYFLWNLYIFPGTGGACKGCALDLRQFLSADHYMLQLVELRRSEGWTTFGLAAVTNDFCHLESLPDTANRSATVHVRLFIHECHIVLPTSRGVVVESGCLPLLWLPYVNWPMSLGSYACAVRAGLTLGCKAGESARKNGNTLILAAQLGHTHTTCLPSTSETVLQPF